MLQPLRPFPPVDPDRVAHFRAGRECARGGCHRTARRWVRNWNLCDPCADAIAVVKEK